MKKDVNFSYYYWTENLVLKSCFRTYHEEYPVELATKLPFTYLVDEIVNNYCKKLGFKYIKKL